jgi:hypothetical protein
VQLSTIWVIWCPSYGKTAQLGSVGLLWKTRVSPLLHAMFGAALNAQENRVLMLPGLHGSIHVLEKKTISIQRDLCCRLWKEY